MTLALGLTIFAALLGTVSLMLAIRNWRRWRQDFRRGFSAGERAVIDTYPTPPTTVSILNALGDEVFENVFGPPTDRERAIAEIYDFWTGRRGVGTYQGPRIVPPGEWPEWAIWGSTA